MNAHTRRIFALVLPLIVLAAMIVRSEVIIGLGRSYEVNIGGYDPRDLLRGHYLVYRVQWNQSQRDTCHGDSCCLCIETDAEPVNPRVHWSGCTLTEQCQARIRPEALGNLQKYFIPQENAANLERLVRSRRATLKIDVSPDGDAVAEQLLIDGQPWQDVMETSN